MGKAARAWVLDHYAHSQVLNRTVLYYKSLLELNLSRISRTEPVSSGSALNPV
jgi:hypothetical protein